VVFLVSKWTAAHCFDFGGTGFRLNRAFLLVVEGLLRHNYFLTCHVQVNIPQNKTKHAFGSSPFRSRKSVYYFRPACSPLQSTMVKMKMAPLGTIIVKKSASAPDQFQLWCESACSKSQKRIWRGSLRITYERGSKRAGRQCQNMLYARESISPL